MLNPAFRGDNKFRGGRSKCVVDNSCRAAIIVTLVVVSDYVDGFFFFKFLLACINCRSSRFIAFTSASFITG